MSHHHHHSHNDIDQGKSRKRALMWAFAINAAFLILEVVGGILSGSIALLADAGHMLTDVAALGVALWVSRVVIKPPSAKRTFGYGRAEVLSGLINGLSLWVIVGFILYESIHRFWEPQEVDISVMLPIAIAGLLANIISAAFLWSHHKHDLNVRGAFLHLVGDSVGSIGAILAALAIRYMGWSWADPLASLFIALLIFISSWSLVRESIHILLEGTPNNLDLKKIKRKIESLELVRSCHDLHAWSVGSGEPMLSAHIISEEEACYSDVLDGLEKMMKDDFKIEHTTFQIEGKECDHGHEW